MTVVNEIILQCLVGILFLRISKYNGSKAEKWVGFLWFVLAGITLGMEIF